MANILNNHELRGILIAISGYILVSGALNVWLRNFNLKWPWLLLFLAGAFLFMAKFFITKIPFLSREDGFLGDTIRIVIIMIAYSLFIKSLMVYLSPLMESFAPALFAIGFILLMYATKFHLKGGMN